MVDTTGTIRSPLPPINSGPFLNFQAFISSGYHVAGYWTGVTYGANPNESWNFLPFDGMQSSQYKDGNLLAVWPVRDGDVLPVPWLTILLAGTNATLAWPVQFPTFHLQEIDLLGATNWTSVAVAPVDDGRHFLVPLPLSVTNRFFRLVSP